MILLILDIVHKTKLNCFFLLFSNFKVILLTFVSFGTSPSSHIVLNMVSTCNLRNYFETQLMNAVSMLEMVKTTISPLSLVLTLVVGNNRLLQVSFGPIRILSFQTKTVTIFYKV